MWENYILCLILVGFHFGNLSASQMNSCDQFENENGIDSYYCRNNSRNGCKESASTCRDWCVKNISWSLINSETGLVKFSQIPSPSICCHNAYEISLYVFEENECNEQTIAKCKHSVKHVVERNCHNENCTTDCEEMMEFQIKYVFTSWYYLVIKPFRDRNSMQACISEKIFIETNYTKQLIGNNKIAIHPSYKEDSEELSFVVSGGGNGLHLAEQVSFFLLPGCGQDELQVVLSQKTGTDFGECCNKNVSLTENCGCYWDSNLLTCKFSNILPGNYCVHIEVKDPRCASLTLWGNINTCSWHSSYQLLGPPIASTSYTPPSSSINFNMTVLWLIILGCSAALVITIILCVYYRPNPKKIYADYVSCAPSHMEQLATFNKQKILLLYPRDCEHFMKAMTSFRCLLQELLHAQVYDMWDMENWDSVNEVGHQWAIKYISDKTIKVIIIASSCSKMFEYALINHKTIEYKSDANCFDSIFLYSFKESITLANYSSDNYKRFFVVRLDEPDCEYNRFSVITPLTVYTIPQHLKDLTLHIHNMDPGEVVLNPEEISKINQLNNSIKELRTFKLNNPNYLSDLISVVNDVI